MMILDWVFNNDFIVENYCVNKDVEEFTCNGSCHLSKQINKVDEQSTPKESNIPSIYELESLLNLSSENSDQYLAIEESINPLNIYYCNLLTQEVTYDIFHPPQV
jgi:hypothetical protein